MNWKNEIKKWLGDDRIRVFAVDHKTNVKHFTVGRASHVMVIGYEKVNSHLVYYGYVLI